VIKRYKKKPVVVKAIQLHAKTIDEVYDFLGISNQGNFPGCGSGIDPVDGKFKITTLEGVMIAEMDDYIIQGVEGEFYPCKPSIFEKTYELDDSEKDLIIEVSFFKPNGKWYTSGEVNVGSARLWKGDLLQGIKENQSIVSGDFEQWTIVSGDPVDMNSTDFTRAVLQIGKDS
jgi:hypothetical protein